VSGCHTDTSALNTVTIKFQIKTCKFNDNHLKTRVQPTTWTSYTPILNIPQAMDNIQDGCLPGCCAVCYDRIQQYPKLYGYSNYRLRNVSFLWDSSFPFRRWKFLRSLTECLSLQQSPLYEDHFLLRDFWLYGIILRLLPWQCCQGRPTMCSYYKAHIRPYFRVGIWNCIVFLS
jgi:hypothetical protein